MPKRNALRSFTAEEQASLEQLFQQGIQLITKLKSNIQNRLMPFSDKPLLRKCATIDPIIAQLDYI